LFSCRTLPPWVRHFTMQYSNWSLTEPRTYCPHPALDQEQHNARATNRRSGSHRLGAAHVAEDAKAHVHVERVEAAGDAGVVFMAAVILNAPAALMLHDAQPSA
jgi:hypothetical protein